ncbi:MAG: 2-C-methyl-D-erythritol 4-phosphate cytidylyltransferase [Clostridia bacterium]|nr:2-C-methyl-D-erythritol 4-phosphate cytidylyltransferase [Clostridia bacterium]
MVITCIVAGGSGTRMGHVVPKQFLPLLGEPVLMHTVRRFLAASDKILIGTPPDYVEETKQMFPQENVTVLQGGRTRMETVQNLVLSLDCADGDVIITHDGVRPFVSAQVLAQTVQAARQSGASGVFVPCVDTIAVSEDGAWLKQVPPRSKLYHVQTPQTFLYGTLKRLLPYAHEGMTDLCSLALERGEKVAMVEGDYYNIKLTHPDDLTQAEQICRRYFGTGQD